MNYSGCELVYDGALSCVVENPSDIVENISFNQLSIEELKKLVVQIGD